MDTRHSAWGFPGEVQAVASLSYKKMVFGMDDKNLTVTVSYLFLSSPWH